MGCRKIDKSLICPGLKGPLTDTKRLLEMHTDTSYCAPCPFSLSELNEDLKGAGFCAGQSVPSTEQKHCNLITFGQIMPMKRVLNDV